MADYTSIHFLQEKKKLIMATTPAWFSGRKYTYEFCSLPYLFSKHKKLFYTPSNNNYYKLFGDLNLSFREEHEDDSGDECYEYDSVTNSLFIIKFLGRESQFKWTQKHTTEHYYWLRVRLTIDNMVDSQKKDITLPILWTNIGNLRALIRECPKTIELFKLSSEQNFFLDVDYSEIDNILQKYSNFLI